VHALVSSSGELSRVSTARFSFPTAAGALAQHHAYLLLTHNQGKTMVLETGEELQEVTER
jgi:hypothetical protein